MSKPGSTDHFTPELAQQYDARNRKLAPIGDNLHFLMGLVLRDLPADARILCVGVGTGAEILSLSQSFPGWTFVGVEPSAGMLSVCKERLEAAGVLSRCELIRGYVDDAPAGESFDAAVTLLVAHFVEKDARRGFFEGMVRRLKPGGMLVDAEISCALEGPTFPSMLAQWSKIQERMGGTPESLAKLPMQLRDVLSVLRPEETEALLAECGLANPVRFFQSFMIHAWYGTKSSL